MSILFFYYLVQLLIPVHQLQLLHCSCALQLQLVFFQLLPFLLHTSDISVCLLNFKFNIFKLHFHLFIFRFKPCHYWLLCSQLFLSIALLGWGLIQLLLNPLLMMVQWLSDLFQLGFFFVESLLQILQCYLLSFYTVLVHSFEIDVRHESIALITHPIFLLIYFG